jgi:carbamoyltransferase
MADEPAWERLFGFPRREAEGELGQEHCDLALAIQRVTERVVLAMAAEAKRLTGSANLCLAGGVALNCVANGRLLRSGIVDGLWIQPAAGDAGGALGAALCAYHIGRGNPRAPGPGGGDRMHGSYLGPEEEACAADRQLLRGREAPPTSTRCVSGPPSCSISPIVGWVRGRMEGPARSGPQIPADPRNPEIQRGGLKIKYRETSALRAVGARRGGASYFGSPSLPHMLLIADVQLGWRRPLPPGCSRAAAGEASPPALGHFAVTHLTIRRASRPCTARRIRATTR